MLRSEKEMRPLQAGVFSAAGVLNMRGPVADRSIDFDGARVKRAERIVREIAARRAAPA